MQTVEHTHRSLLSMRGAAHVATSTKIKSMPAAGLLPVTPSWTTSLLNTPLHAPCWISALKPSLANSWISSFFPEAEQTAKGHSGNKLFQSFYLYLPAFSLLPRLLFSSFSFPSTSLYFPFFLHRHALLFSPAFLFLLSFQSVTIKIWCSFSPPPDKSSFLDVTIQLENYYCRKTNYRYSSVHIIIDYRKADRAHYNRHLSFIT